MPPNVSLPHHLEPAGERDGVRFLNDSAATTPEALAETLRTFPEQTATLHLIAGGFDKGPGVEGAFAALRGLLRGRVRSVTLLGSVAPRLEALWQGVVPSGALKVQPTLEAAVQHATVQARPGDVVLLSPGCPSWGLFRNFIERGNRLRSLVEELG